MDEDRNEPHILFGDLTLFFVKYFVPSVICIGTEYTQEEKKTATDGDREISDRVVEYEWKKSSRQPTNSKEWYECSAVLKICSIRNWS